jgi:hypothetical protein
VVVPSHYHLEVHLVEVDRNPLEGVSLLQHQHQQRLVVVGIPVDLGEVSYVAGVVVVDYHT